MLKYLREVPGIVGSALLENGVRKEELPTEWKNENLRCGTLKRPSVLSKIPLGSVGKDGGGPYRVGKFPSGYLVQQVSAELRLHSGEIQRREKSCVRQP